MRDHPPQPETAPLPLDLPEDFEPTPPRAGAGAVFALAFVTGTALSTILIAFGARAAAIAWGVALLAALAAIALGLWKGWK
ncbi:hypothetical protein [Xinfangfangia pollutisoli]|uniref:hypothetical protein n=1 Tax=Xinfangfangia pollutisoli TaxID=2865960 RepID=UPI001CD5B37B|nr:hypothetical protein [Xinfangfangia pollutisoli]